MKPTKNRRFCPDCGRVKMVFETEGSALKFIQFNGDEIMASNGHAPTRAYYCDLCCGWHITSHQTHVGKNRSRKQLEDLMESNRRMQERKEVERARRWAKSSLKNPLAPFMTPIMQLALDAVMAIRVDDIAAARQHLDQAKKLFFKIQPLTKKGSPKLRKRLYDQLTALDAVLNDPLGPSGLKVDEIFQNLLAVKNMNGPLFSYDPQLAGATVSEVTPDNIDEHLEAIQHQSLANQMKKLQAEQLREDIQETLWLAKADILCEDLDEARAHLLKAINLIEQLQQLSGQQEFAAQVMKIYQELNAVD